MDAIDTFLDAMFAPYPATPRLLEAKGELHAMMEDAYTDAISKGKTHNEAVGRVLTGSGATLRGSHSPRAPSSTIFTPRPAPTSGTGPISTRK